MHPERILHDIAITQGGVITRAQAEHSGLTRHQIDHMVKATKWVSLGRGAYRVLDMSDAIDRVRAAVTVLPGAVVSHFSAAAQHGIESLDAYPASVLVHSQTTHGFVGVRVFRCHDLESSHIEVTDGMPTTTVARTVVDLAAVSRRHRLESIVDEVFMSGATNVEEVRDVLRAVARKGKPGVRRIREILDDRSGEAHPMSPLERAGCALLREGGFDGFETEFPIPWSPNRRFDVAFPSHRLAIEWDSRRWHDRPGAFQADRYRDQDATAHGWTIVRFTWIDVHESPGRVIEIVASVIGRVLR